MYDPCKELWDHITAFSKYLYNGSWPARTSCSHFLLSCKIISLHSWQIIAWPSACHSLARVLWIGQFSFIRPLDLCNCDFSGHVLHAVARRWWRGGQLNFAFCWQSSWKYCKGWQPFDLYHHLISGIFHFQGEKIMLHHSQICKKPRSTQRIFLISCRTLFCINLGHVQNSLV